MNNLTNERRIACVALSGALLASVFRLVAPTPAIAAPATVHHCTVTTPAAAAPQKP